MRASNNRTNPRHGGDSVQRSWTSLLAGRMQWTAARKSTALKTDSGTKAEVSHAEGAVVDRSRIERGLDLGILLTTEKQPAMERRNEAPRRGIPRFSCQNLPELLHQLRPDGSRRRAPPLPPPPHFATFPLGLSCEGMGERDANALGGFDNLFGSERPAGRAERRPRQTKKHL